MSEIKPEDLTDDVIRAAERDGIISPNLASAAIRIWHTGTGMARRGARIEIVNALNARKKRP